MGFVFFIFVECTNEVVCGLAPIGDLKTPTPFRRNGFRLVGGFMAINSAERGKRLNSPRVLLRRNRECLNINYLHPQDFAPLLGSRVACSMKIFVCGAPTKSNFRSLVFKNVLPHDNSKLRLVRFNYSLS